MTLQNVLQTGLNMGNRYLKGIFSAFKGGVGMSDSNDQMVAEGLMLIYEGSGRDPKQFIKELVISLVAGTLVGDADEFTCALETKKRSYTINIKGEDI